MRVIGVVALLLSFISVLQAQTVHRVCVDWDTIAPISVYMQPGDIITFFGTQPTQSHWIVQVFANFTGQNFTGPLTGVPQPGVFEYNVTLTSDDDNGIPWADLFNPATAVFGIVYIARPDDVSITWTVFKTSPPSASNFALDDKYPYNITILKGQRVVWDASSEPLLNHVVYFTDLQWQASIGCPWAHPWVSNRNFHHFVWTFDAVGSYRYICGIHTSMRGVIKVCPRFGQNCFGGNFPQICYTPAEH